jgi:hypothetical protein
MREAGPIPLLSPEERRRQASWGLRHVAALDDPAGTCESGGPSTIPGSQSGDQGARYISICLKVWSDRKNDYIFPGNAHVNLSTALEDAFYWANKRYDVYWAMGAQASAGKHSSGKRYPSAIRQGPNTIACRCVYLDIDVKNGAYESTRKAAEAFAPKNKRAKDTIGLWSWWMAHKQETHIAVFKPHGDVGPYEWNMWSGWGVEPNPNNDQKLQTIISHFAHIICRGDMEKFCYILMWLAWKVQHPDLPAEAFIVLKSSREGTGKNIVANMVAKIFGKHGRVFADKEHLLGTRAVNEQLCFVVLDEAIFYGDKKTADLLKSVITNPTRTINPKYQALREIANMYGLWILTNHDYAVPAGHGARRPVILDVSEDKAGDEQYFNRLAEAIGDGGAGQFLHYLLNVKLGDWHPRTTIKTQELADHQRASLPSTYQWLLTHVETGTPIIDSPTRNALKSTYGSNKVPIAILYNCYFAWVTNNTRGGTEIIDQFGKHLTEVFGPKCRLPADSAGHRPWAYTIPDDEDTLREKIESARGIKHRN